jgi:DNA-binding response OmpR family regulator
MIKILLLEDDLSLIDGLSYSLKKQGIDTDIAPTLREAESFFAT